MRRRGKHRPNLRALFFDERVDIEIATALARDLIDENEIETTIAKHVLLRVGKNSAALGATRHQPAPV